MPLLVLQNVNKQFNNQTVFSRLSFNMQAGEVFCITGPKGSGKSTLLNLISGLDQPASGQILFRGQNLHGRPLNQYALLGIARTFSSPQNFTNLSVLENVLIGTHPRGTWNMTGALHGLFAPCVKGEEKTLKELALACISKVGLEKQLEQPAGNLSPFDQKRLELGRTMASQPVLLMLDEPFAGLSENEYDFLSALFLELNSSGTNILFTADDVAGPHIADFSNHCLSLTDYKD